MTRAKDTSTNLLGRLLDAPYGAYAIDLDQYIVFWNCQAERILGYKRGQVLGRKCFEVLKTLSFDGTSAVCQRNCPAVIAANRGKLHPVGYVRMLCASGQRKLVTVIPLITTNEDDRVLLVHMFHETPTEPGDPEKPEPLPLTPRELEVLSLLALDMRPPEVAEKLLISVHTVRKHISNACEKLHAHGTMSAVLAAQRRRLI